MFLVFFWHLNAEFNGGATSGPLAFPLSLFTEGHTGVAIFMVLSGYLFAKLIGENSVQFVPFLFNRILRIFPLLVLIILINAVIQLRDGTIRTYLKALLEGIALPTLPNGGWSITVEFHLYILLPVLLVIARRSKWAVLLLVLFSVFVKAWLYQKNGEVQHLAYWTIVGRFDQFVIGIFFYQAREKVRGQHIRAAVVFVVFLTFWFQFDKAGGFYAMPSYPSPNPVWIVLPAIEGIAYGWLICWYDNSFQPAASRASRFLAFVGANSFSIYLLHFFVVFDMAPFVDRQVVKLENPYAMFAIALPCFLLILPVAHLSRVFIENPFLKWRRPYLRLRHTFVPELR